MMTTTKKRIPLPKILAKQWKIVTCLSIKNDSEVYLLEGITHRETMVLKLFYKNSFSKKKYKKISHFPEEYLVIPKKHYHISGTHYVLYPEYITLKDILCKNGISLWELFSLGIDLTYAVTILYERHFYEADISPNNIFQNKEKIFCLGDINLQISVQKGTTGYFAPELSGAKQKSLSKASFDKAMQYSICKLLNCIYVLNESTETKIISAIFKKGMQEQPDQRYNSLTALRKELQKQQKKLEADRSYQLFQTNDANHILFRTKTVPTISKEKIMLYPILWSILVLIGCIFLVALYRNLHPDNHSTKSGIYLSQMAQFTPISTTEKTASTSTIEPQPSKKTVELDFRKQGLKSFSLPLSRTKHPEQVTCLYAGENHLTDTVSIQHFSKLNELYLDSNHIKKLSGISSLNELKILVLSYNQLTTLPDISDLTSLRHLDVSSNKDFRDFDSLINLTGLTTLNIAETGISEKQYQMLCRKLRRCMIIY